LNNKAAIQKATEMKQTLNVCVAQDSCRGKPIEDQTIIKKLLELSDSKTEHLPGLLPLIPGMPVMLTQNIAIELGLINGTNGVFRQLVYEEDSTTTDSLSEKTFPSNTMYIRKPLYAIIEIIKSNNEYNFNPLPSNLVPIPLMEQTFRINIADILPKDKKPKPNQKTMLSIKRRALPLVPAYSITTHKSQGQTLKSVVIDLKLPHGSDDIAAIYVPLSRVKRLEDLVILRHFDYKVLLMKPSKSQLTEIERLDNLYKDTQLQFAQWF
jgi:ATP-dependent DNA helicase PIF1